jgi:hypothetical protein
MIADINEIAFAVSLDILKVFAGVLREEEHSDALAEIVPHVKRALQMLENRGARRQQRLHPSKN